ncbi:hypothetical protein DDB_G0285387 [Dictyostelium discoideum AX4]|uniref:Uncharacterized protein n=1 Tax=Dictyostelium discoideum TaxID=44689 RepID=Q54N96_DICDI|nr:hypothetical protein DDB_G0285387 [Dictyostelium discoideum AX4]EAL64768.1 hypothetical protein DDB_G0285387 [Dictyostelium discoideum AX4]|eukprot:XP_638284.1 hypothetical protein DDB_G0285387 [Dictyostelium discoideum AX4]
MPLLSMLFFSSKQEDQQKISTNPVNKNNGNNYSKAFLTKLNPCFKVD